MTKPIRIAVIQDPRTQLWTAVADHDGILLCIADDMGPMFEIVRRDEKRIRGIFQSSPIPDDEIPYA